MDLHGTQASIKTFKKKTQQLKRKSAQGIRSSLFSALTALSRSVCAKTIDCSVSGASERCEVGMMEALPACPGKCNSI